MSSVCLSSLVCRVVSLSVLRMLSMSSVLHAESLYLGESDSALINHTLFIIIICDDSKSTGWHPSPKDAYVCMAACNYLCGCTLFVSVIVSS